MIGRVGRAIVWGLVIALLFWLVGSILVVMNSLIPWWVVAGVALLVIIAELLTEPFFREKEVDDSAELREAARLAALAELEQRMRDQGLTDV